MKPQTEHQFTSSWRWPDSFESWVESLITGHTVNVASGLSPLGDIRLDIMSPPEIISSLQGAKNTSLSDARDACSGVLKQFVNRDVTHDLYKSSLPPDPALARHIDTGGFLRADIFSDSRLPVDTNTADWTICDPPWKSLSPDSKQRLFSELTRITTPGGHILFNAWWVPTSEYTTLDYIRVRRDDERNGAGTPNISYASIHTVHPSPHTARYLSQTFTNREYAPKPTSLKQAIEAETAYRLEHVDRVDHTAYDIRAVGPDTSQRCPHCGNTRLSPATGGGALNTNADEPLYKCRHCEYPIPQHELDAIMAGKIQRVRYTHGWSSISPKMLEDIELKNPPKDIIDQLETEPGIDNGEGEAYLRSALGIKTSSSPPSVPP